MYSRLSTGKVSAWKRRQYGQVIEAYWTIVTGASLRPSAISGSSPAFMISASGGSLSTVRVLPGFGGVSWKGSKPGASTLAPPAASAAVAGGSGAGPPPASPPRPPARGAPLITGQKGPR